MWGLLLSEALVGQATAETVVCRISEMNMCRACRWHLHLIVWKHSPKLQGQQLAVGPTAALLLLLLLLLLLTAASAMVAWLVKIGGSWLKSSPAAWQLNACRWLTSSWASKQRMRKLSAVCNRCHSGVSQVVVVVWEAQGPPQVGDVALHQYRHVVHCQA
jgi:hypothetical protein